MSKRNDQATPASLSENEIKLKSLIYRKERYFSRLQTLFDQAKSVEKDESKLSKLLSRYDEIRNIRDAFEETIDQINILQLSINPNYAFSTREVESFDELYYIVKEIFRKISTMEGRPKFEYESSSNRSAQPKLPKIQLVQFDGKLENWVTFRDTFCSLIHSNTSISNVDKFNYLLSTVTGPALQIARMLPVSCDNYDIVWSALTERYENKRALATRYLDKMFNFRPLSNESLSGLNSFLDTFQENIQALEKLNIEDLAGFILFYFSFRNLDSVTKRSFEQSVGSNQIPIFDDLRKFITSQVRILEMTEGYSASVNKSSNYNRNIQTSKKPTTQKSCLTTSNNQKFSNKKCCLFCKQDTHSIYRCFQYLALSPADRMKHVTSMKLCENCLRKGHAPNEGHAPDFCPSKVVCVICKAKHHVTLHMDSNMTENVSSNMLKNQSHTEKNEFLSSSSLTCSARSTVLLGTAIIHVLDSTGSYQPVRVVIDSGAQNGFITNGCAQRLGLPRRRCQLELRGLGGALVRDHGIISVNFKPSNANEPILQTEVVVVSKITGDMPTVSMPIDMVNQYKHLVLADPTFHRSSSVDMLLAGDVFPYIYDGAIFQPPQQNAPPALRSIFGYVITGPLSISNVSHNESSCLHVSTEKLDKLITSFWEAENVSTQLPPNPNDAICEHKYVTEHSRDSSGRYTVCYPFKSESVELGDSLQSALKQFYNLERRLSRMPNLRSDYHNFMSEYLSLGHMNLVGSLPAFQSPGDGYFIPHHCVHRLESSTTKTRVVFNASCQTSNSLSLNSVLHTGPNLLADLVQLLIKFRLREICLVGDITKMYRQILIDPMQRKYQKILWRFSPENPVQIYELSTVTYGIVSSPFLAIRTLKQLANDDGEKYPLAARALQDGFYMDDFLYSVDTPEQALELQRQMLLLLNGAGFELRKFSSNCHEVLKNLSSEQLEKPREFDDGMNLAVKVLGLHWLPSQDCFSFSTSVSNSRLTKRSVLSQIAKLYDPLGFAAPCVFYAKCFMQDLWKLDLNWDDNLPNHLQLDWLKYSSELSLLSQVRHERFALLNGLKECQVIGFCDASERGFAAAIYLRSSSSTGETKVSLLMSKSKVAPLSTVSIPRLELMAAHLLSKLFKYVNRVLENEINVSEQLAFSDSMVTLAWLNTPPYKLKTFIANRVASIHENSSMVQWFHVEGTSNVVDVCSRGVTPSAFISISNEWLNGPQWLYQDRKAWPVKSIDLCDHSGSIPELKSNSEQNVLLQIDDIDTTIETINRFSNFNKLQRCYAWCYRFINNCRNSQSCRSRDSLTTSELQGSHDMLVKLIQIKYFSSEIESLRKGLQCSPYLRKLNPFIDDRGFLRVGGRLSQGDISFSKRHPLLLPKKCHFTNIIVDYFHKVYLHAGPRCLQGILSQKYWIISARCVIRSRLSKCITCFKVKPSTSQPMMGSLPKCRLQDIYPFHTAGVDIGGPFFTKESSRRNAAIHKSYLCLFVCYSTRAVHCEVLSALTCDCFLAAFDRFTSRRGLVHTIFSDNGRNFLAASKHLNEVVKFFKSNTNELTSGLAERKVNWKFNPPTGSNFGGVFEAGIKSAKFHLRRVVQDRALTFEELTTLFARIEAILNSRPLGSLSNDPNEFDFLSPSHFLVGRELVSAPEYDLTDEPMNQLTRWQYIQQATQHFWRRFRQEYLHTLQQRQKWTSDPPNLKIGDLVLIHADNVPSQTWARGRVEKIHPSSIDNRVRVVTLRTRNGFLDRPVNKLSPMPMQIEHN